MRVLLGAVLLCSAYGLPLQRDILDDLHPHHELHHMKADMKMAMRMAAEDMKKLAAHPTSGARAPSELPVLLPIPAPANVLAAEPDVLHPEAAEEPVKIAEELDRWAPIWRAAQAHLVGAVEASPGAFALAGAFPVPVALGVNMKRAAIRWSW